MTLEPNDDDRVRRFVCNDLDGQEREEIERRLLADGEFADAVGAIEDELVLEYVEGTLAADWRRRFEACLATSPARRQRVEQTRLLLAALAVDRESQETTSPAARIPPWALMLAAAAVLIGVAVALRPLWRGSPTPTPVTVGPLSEVPQVVSFVLASPGVKRRQQPPANTLAPPPRTTAIRLSARIETDVDLDSRLSTRIERIGGSVAVPPSQAEIRVRGRVVEIGWTVPANLLGPGHYVLTLTSERSGREPEELAFWLFTILE